jgi:hypothetical protein
LFHKYEVATNCRTYYPGRPRQFSSWYGGSDAEVLLIFSSSVFSPFISVSIMQAWVVLAIGWGTRRRDWRGLAVLLVSAVFLVPGAAFFQALHAAGRISDATWRTSTLWNVFLGPQATWAVLVLLIILFSSPKHAVDGFRTANVQRRDLPNESCSPYHAVIRQLSCRS